VNDYDYDKSKDYVINENCVNDYVDDVDDNVNDDNHNDDDDDYATTTNNNSMTTVIQTRKTLISR